MKTTHALVAKRFADIDKDVSEQTIWNVIKRVIKLKDSNPQLTREQLIRVLVPDYRR
jgi:hypothetical protein